MEWSDSLLDGLPDPLLRWFACDCAERALERERKAGREPDPRSWRAVEVARRFALGEADTEELTGAAIAAARAAAWAANAAAWAAWAADAADAAARAANAAERSWQIRRLAYLREVWQIAGLRGLLLIRDGICPIPWEDTA